MNQKGLPMNTNMESQSQRELAVPRLLEHLSALAGRLSKQSEELEARLSKGLRPESTLSQDACKPQSPDCPADRCHYEEQLSDVLGQLRSVEHRVDDILGRLEI